MNNDAFGVVSHNILRSCNLGVGAGPSRLTTPRTPTLAFGLLLLPTGQLSEPLH